MIEIGILEYYVVSELEVALSLPVHVHKEGEDRTIDSCVGELRRGRV